MSGGLANQFQNAVVTEVRTMKVSTGVAAAYTCKVFVPAFSILLDVGLHCVALWDAGTSATGKVGDAVDDDGVFTAIDLKATDLIAAESIAVSGGTALAGGKVGADIANSQWNRRYLTTDRIITFTNTLVGTAATTGETIFWVSFVTFVGPNAPLRTNA
jgi:hypothetical protein